MKNLKTKIIINFLILFFLSISIVYAAIGVGFSIPGTINMGIVKPNKLYDIWEAFVINTGDEYGCYKMNVSYFQDQPEKRVPQEWIIYNPLEFCLDPNEAKLVDIDLLVNPSIRLDNGLKGNYFSFLEACTYQGFLGACAATKLYFSI